MKKAKRIFSFLLVFAMLLSTCSVVCMAEDVAVAAASEEDIKIADKLVVLGVADERDAASLSAFVPRRDMVSILVKYLRLSSVTVDKPVSPFLDVNAFDPQISDFHTLYNAGYISGDGAGYYRPDDNLTYNEAVTMVINAIGYRSFAERSGGYPAGYLYIANKYDMLDGLKGSGSNPIPYYDLYRLLNAGLHAPALVVNLYDNDGNGDFTLSKDIAFVEENYGLKIIEGIVTGNENTRLSGSQSDKIDRYQIEIDNVVYDAPEQEYADLLGYPVTAYAKKDSTGSYELVYAEAQHDKYVEMELSADDLLKAKTTSSRIYYLDEAEKERHINVLATMPDVIYNGKCRTGFGTLANTLPDAGHVLALDNNKDGVYDVLFVWEYENFVVDSMDTYTCVYQEAYSTATLTLDPDADDIRVYNAAGKEVQISQLEKGTAISVFKSKNTSGYKLITIHILEETVEGTVEEITSDNTYIINGKEYELAKNLQDYITNSQFAPIKPNLEATFLLDKGGKIALYEVDTTTTEGKYGFIAGIDAKYGLSRALTLKIFTQDGNWLEAELATNASIDGYRTVISTDADITTAQGRLTAGEIVIFTEKGGKINYIDTKAANYGNDTPLKDKGNLREITTGPDFRTRYGIADPWNDTTQSQFVVPSGKVVVFYTPAEDALLEDETMYEVTTSLGSKAAFGGASANNYGAQGQRISSFTAYNLGESDIEVATCLLLRGTSGSGSSSINQNTPFVIVSKTTQALDDEGEMKTKLYYYNGGAEFGALVNDTVTYGYVASRSASGTPTPFAQTELKPGDVIQLGTDDKGIVNAINVVYRLNQSATLMSTYNPTTPLRDLAWLQFPEYNLTFETYQNGAAIGTLEAVDLDNMILSFKSAEDKIYYIGIDEAKASVFRTSTMKGEDTSFSALQKGDRVIVISTNGYSAKAANILAIR